jgi:hypothetical protein
MRSAQHVPPGRISKNDIEDKLRALQGGVEESIQSRRQKLIAGGIAVAVLTLLIAYVLGRRVGRRKTAVVEIRRF